MVRKAGIEKFEAGRKIQEKLKRKTA